jgi:hypothetical protein
MLFNALFVQNTPPCSPMSGIVGNVLGSAKVADIDGIARVGAEHHFTYLVPHHSMLHYAATALVQYILVSTIFPVRI